MAHAVQLFDSDESLASEVAAFLHRGYLLGEHVRLIATADHLAGICRQLEHRGCPVSDIRGTSRLQLLEATATVQSLMPGGRLCSSRMHSFVRELVGQAEVFRAPMCVYGEMVDVLAERGEFKAVIGLEAAWTRALAGLPASLLCGYRSSRFGSRESATTLGDICGQHDEVRTSQSDLLGAWLVAQARH